MVGGLPGFQECFQKLEGKPRDLAESMRETVEEALVTAPLAGPEETFRQEILLAAQSGVELHEMSMEEDVAAVVRLYAGAALDVPTDRLPLGEPDRIALRKLHDR